MATFTSRVREWAVRLAGSLRRGRSDRDLEEELRSHLEMAAHHAQRASEAAEDAARLAAVTYGRVSQAIEAQRDQRGFPWLTSFVSDVRYGSRQMVRAPGVSFAAVSILALGIGLNTSFFALLNGFVLRPPRVHEPDRVITVLAQWRDRPGVWAPTVPYPDYCYYRDHNDVFAGLAASFQTAVTYGGVSDPRVTGRSGSLPEEPRIFVQLVSHNYFDVLGARPVLGRTFLPEEDAAVGTHPVAVISHAFWTHRLHADAAVIGKRLTLNGGSFTVVGVANREFGGNRLLESSVWIPSMMTRLLTGIDLSKRRGAYVDIIGRLKPGDTLAQAQAQMDVAAQQNNVTHPESEITGVRLERISRRADQAIPVVTLIMSLAGLVLLVIAANVANLSLARGASRSREISLRLALGASRGRIVRQLLAESMVVSALGGAIGACLALILPRLLFGLLARKAGPLMPFDFLLEADFTPDLRVLAYTGGLCLLTGLVVGLLPALQTTRTDLTSALRNVSHLFHRRMNNSRLQNLLVITQVAVCLILLVGSGLLVRGLQRASAIDTGFNTNQVLVVRQDLKSHGYDPGRIAHFQLQLTEQLRAVQGVAAVGLTSEVPLQGGFATGPISGRAGDQQLQVGYFFVSPEFFSTLEIKFVSGRNFDPSEMAHSRPLAIINEELARRLWRGEDAVGKHLHGFRNGQVEVVGVVKNTRSGQLWESRAPIVYFLYRPLAKDTDLREMATVIRTAGDPRRVLEDVRNTILGLDGELRPTLRPLEDSVTLQLLPSRAAAYLAGALGLSALLITSIGLYGVVAHTTRRRTREIGIRIALGAHATDVVQSVLGHGWRLLAIGVTFGMLGAVFVGRVLAAFIYDVSPMDPVTFGSVTFILAGVATLACWLPARWAAQVDPVIALRYD